MTVKVNFNINPENNKLEVSLERDNETDQEFDIAKRILGLSTQLHFVSFPESNGIDVGASIIVEMEEEESYYDEDDDFYSMHDDDIDNENDDESFVNQDELVASSKPELSIEDVADVITEEQFNFMNDEVKEIDCNKTKKQIEEMLKDGRSIGWKSGDSYVNIIIDLDDAKSVIGGLTTPSSIATMMIYELLKRTITKVEKYV